MKIYYFLFLFIAITKQSFSQCLGIQMPANNDYVKFSAPYSAYTNSITVEAWIYVDATTNSNIWMGQGTPGIDNMSNNVWLWHSSGTNQFTWYVNDAGSWRNINSSVLPNGWHHVATVADNVSTRIYIDGILDNTGAGISTGLFNNTSSEIQVGQDVRFAAGGGRNGNIKVSEFRVWSSSRTLTELNTYKSSCLNGSETDLRLYNKFEDGTGSNISTSITGPNGTLTNMTASSDWITGSGTECCSLPGAALNFDGADDIVSITTSSNIPIGNSNYTIEAKIKTTVTGSKGIVGWGNYGNTNQVNAFRLGAGGYLINYWWGNDLAVNTSPIDLADDNWHHVAATFDGTTRKIFIDGILKGQDTPSGHAVPSTANLAIGRTLSGEFFYGSLDEIRIWNRGLPQGEIQNNMNCELPSGQSGLVAYYKCSQGFDGSNNAGVTTLTDASGNSNNGTLTNFLLTGATSNWIAPGSVTSGSSCSDYSIAITASISNQSNVICNGGSSGSATVTVAGTGPFTYTWSPSGGNAATASGLSAGNYTCSVANSLGGSSIVTVTITQPGALTSTVTGTNILCNGGTGSATLSASGGTTSYTYLWSNGATTSTVTNIVAGVYTGTVTDANACKSVKTVTITQPGVLTSTITGTNILCNGGTGSATLSASGGTTSYTYLWSNGATTSTVTNIVAGVYTGTVTDANACKSVKTVTITQPGALTSTITGTNILCNGGTGSATLSASGGTTSYTYLWSNGATTSTITNMVAGVYTGTVTDANACKSVKTVTITQPSVLTTNSSASAILCNGGISTITVTANDGTSPYIGTGTFTMNAGTNTFTVTDDNGCATTTSISVTEPMVLTANSSASAILCNGGISTITVTANDGTAPYSGTGTFTINAGTNTFTVTDDNGCSATTSISVTEPMVLTANSSASAILCNGGISTITVTANDGTSPYIGTGTFTMNAGTSTYTVTDDNGCSTTTSISVTEPTVLTANSFASAILCNGGISTITVTANDGTAPYSGTGTFTINAGTNTFTVTDDNGCSTTTSISVTEPTVLTANSFASAILCNGGISTITVTANDGTSPYIGTGTFTMNAGANTFTVTDDNGCSATTSISVTEPGTINVTTSLNGLTITAIATGVNYQWVDCDNANTIIGGEINQNFNANSNGNYAVIITDGSCSDTSACVNISTVGIKEIENANNVTIYPNPTNGLFVINLKTTTNVSITNSLGQIIINETMNAGKQNLDIQNKANGIYFVKFTQQGKQQIIKLIKE